MTTPKLTVRGLETPPGDDILKFKGLMQLAAPFSPPLDPLHKGARILVQENDGTVVFDAIIPGGAFDTLAGRGWTESPDGHVFKYKQVGKQTPLISGIKKIVIKDFSIRSPGLLKFLVVGKSASVPVTTEPVRATLVIDSPVATTGQCGEATFPGPSPDFPACRPIIAGLLMCK